MPIDKNIKNKSNISRRSFISSLSLAPFAIKSILAQPIDSEPNFNISNTDFAQKPATTIVNNGIIIPDSLKPGDTVAFTAPASPIRLEGISEYVAYFKSKGCKIFIADTIKNQTNSHRYLSGSDEARAAELNSLFANPEIKAIICGRGGYGVMRILNMLDYDILKNNPKIVMGYSDITALLTAIYKKSGIATYHGPVASSKLTNVHKYGMEHLLFENPKPICQYYAPMMKTISSGEAVGQLQGGNLTLISATFGTDYELALDNSILFIEDISILAHDFDRMMNQLILSNKLKTCKAIIFGMMKDLDKRGNFFPNRAYTILELMEQLVKPMGIPAVYNVPFGHVDSSFIFPLGLTARLNTEQQSIEIFNQQS